MNGVKPIKIDKFIGTAIESVWMLYIAIGSNWKFLLSAKIVKNVKYYIGLICWCATFVVVQQNLLMCILNREISCVQREQERQAAWASILVLLWKLEILRERKTILQMIFIVASQAHPRFWSNENSYWIERQRHFFCIDSEHQIVNAWQAESG